MSTLATAPIAAAFALIQSLLPPGVQSATYRRRTAAAYSTATGAATDTFTTVAIQVSVQEYDRHERADSAIQPEDRKALIQGSQLASDPAIGDQLVVAGQTLTVVGVTVDPARVVFTLQVRRAA